MILSHGTKSFFPLSTGQAWFRLRCLNGERQGEGCLLFLLSSWLFLCPLLQDSVASNLGERRVGRWRGGDTADFLKRTRVPHYWYSFPQPCQQPWRCKSSPCQMVIVWLTSPNSPTGKATTCRDPLSTDSSRVPLTFRHCQARARDQPRVSPDTKVKF